MLWGFCFLSRCLLRLAAKDFQRRRDFRNDLPNAGLANVTGVIMNLLGFEAPDFYEPSLLVAGK